MGPLQSVIVISLVVCALAWVASLITKDTSQVDRLWSIVPVIYCWEIVFSAHHSSDSSYSNNSEARLILIALLVTAWGARLTFNFARKGGYSGVEDYRWEVLRSGMTGWQFQLFNFFFIVLYQNFILVLITLPALKVYDQQNKPISGTDLVLSVVFLLGLAGETIADQQQWNFHKKKAARLASESVVSERFLKKGLFKYSRHPNYFFELSQWWLIYLFGAFACGSLFNWTIAGALLLTLLFIGSTRFTEQISLSKYPEYAEFQRTTSAVIPWLSSKEHVKEN